MGVDFERLKKAVTEEPVLALPDHTKAVHTDASDFAIGGVLMQDKHPIAFESRKLLEREKRYMYERNDSRGPLPAHMEALSAGVEVCGDD